MKKHQIIGLMSGTSLDGLDIVFCEFQQKDEAWHFDILDATTIEYSSKWKDNLAHAQHKKAIELIQLHHEFGDLLGKLAKAFIQKGQHKVDFIASHGHTIFHQPEKGFTFQLGEGHSLAIAAGLPAVCDFRVKDVKLGGQGAPLVPIGDRLLFPEFDVCLNLGGFSNCSFEENGWRIAFDICPVNMALNYFSKKIKLEYDDQGKVAASGQMDSTLFEKLNGLAFYAQQPPKSLGREWFEAEFLPICDSFHLSPADQLRTIVEHIAMQLARVIGVRKNAKTLLTGGGAKNTFLFSRINFYLQKEVFIPEEEIVDYKEAMIFAFLGLKRWKGEINCLASVTGARKDSCSGTVFFP
jgi:anhydro-N-acetylmuramic acid kinase